MDDLQLGDDAEPRAVLDSLNRVDQMLVDVLGGSELHSQDRETPTQEVKRLALAEMEADELLYETEKEKTKQWVSYRSRKKPMKPLTPSSSSNEEEMDIELENEGVLGPVRRLARTTVIDSSDSEEEKKENISP